MVGYLRDTPKDLSTTSLLMEFVVRLSANYSCCHPWRGDHAEAKLCKVSAGKKYESGH